MIRIMKTANKQAAEERVNAMRFAINRYKTSDEVFIREFPDGTGQPVYEVWLQHNVDLSSRLDHSNYNRKEITRWLSKES